MTTAPKECIGAAALHGRRAPALFRMGSAGCLEDGLVNSDGVALILLGLLTAWLAWRRHLEGVVLAAALFILPGAASLEAELGGGLGGDLGRLAVGPVSLALLLAATVQEAGRYVLLSVSARNDRSALSAGYAWAAWDLAQSLLAGMHGGGGLDGVVDLLMLRALPSLLHVGLSFVQLWAVRGRGPGQRALIFFAGVGAHLLLTLLILRHGHL